MSEVTADQAAEAQDIAGTPSDEPTPAEKPQQPATNYRVLKEDEERSDWWLDVGVFAARSPKKAVDMAMDAGKFTGGTFVATPDRSFSRVPVKTVTQDRRIFE